MQSIYTDSFKLILKLFNSKQRKHLKVKLLDWRAYMSSCTLVNYNAMDCELFDLQG